MSRLETSAEPSMEEILASIRKIIAEEPLGSKGAVSSKRPPAQSATASTAKRGFMTRESFMRSPAPSEPQSTDPDRDAVKADPEAKTETAPISTPRDLHDDARSTDRTETSRKLDGPHGSAGLNGTEPAGELKDEGKAKSEVSSAAAPEVSSALGHTSLEEKAEAPEPRSSHESKSIEAQLADLLGDDLQALNGTQQDDPAKARALDLSPPVDQNETSHPELSPEDTGSGDKHVNGASEPDSGDPFAFNLGPTPFFLRSEEAQTGAQDTAETPSKFDALQQNESEPSSFDEEHGTTPGSNSYAPAPEPKSPESSTVPPRSERASEAFGVPSVAATLGPHRTLEPLSAAFHSSPFDPPPFEQERSTNVRAEFRGERLERILQPSRADENHQDSAMEDAVADLLRPLLRTWLAENMPKIVERALRREMTERLLPGQKGPFD